MPSIPRPSLVQFPRPWRGIARCKAAIGLSASSVERLHQCTGPPRWGWQSMTTRYRFSTSAAVPRKLEETSTLCGNERRDLPLDGITVVSLEQAIAAPLCTRHCRPRRASHQDRAPRWRRLCARLRYPSARFLGTLCLGKPVEGESGVGHQGP